MKIIDLLNKIANGEELPKDIKFNHIKYHLVDDYYVDDGDSDLFIYIFKHNIDFSVNDEVEILDDEDEENGLPEKIDTSNGISVVNCAYKINEIIDYLEKQREGE